MEAYGMPATGTPRLMRTDGVADYPPRSVRRFEPAIKRMQRRVVHASLLARQPAADPRLR
jgi:hypothetical protein